MYLIVIPISDLVRGFGRLHNGRSANMMTINELKILNFVTKIKILSDKIRLNFRKL